MTLHVEQEIPDTQKTDEATGKLLTKEDMYIIDYIKNTAPYVYDKYDSRYKDTKLKERDFAYIARELGGKWTGKK